MKKTKYYLLLALVVIMSGCDDFLEKNPPSKPSENTFWKQKSDLDMALTACYGTMTKFSHGYFSFGTPQWDSFVDNCHSVGEGITFDVFQGNIDPSTVGIIQDVYKGSYVGITRMNLFLYQLDRYENTDLSETERDFYKGQVLFLRAFYYSFLYRCYGDVPLILEPLDLETQYQPKVEAAKILEQIYSDLDDAIGLLPDNTYLELPGRVTKGAALALKVRIMLYDAYNDNGKADIGKMGNILTVAEQIKGYSLSNDFESIFQGAGQETNTEIIFSTKYLAPNNYTDFDRIYGDYAAVRPVANLTNDYEEGDNRLGQIVAFDDKYQWPGGELLSLPKSDLKKAMVKYLTPLMKEGDSWGASFRSETDFVYLRWGELLLLKAEAANELGLGGVAEMVNQVRTRAGLADLPTNLTQDQLREKIRHERRVETPFEVIRYYDMKRWKIMDKLNGLELDPLLSGHVTAWSKAHEYFPLPQSQIDFSNGVLIQNPNY